MAFNSIPAAYKSAGAAVDTVFMTYTKDNFDYLFSQVASFSGIKNGDFEVDSDADGTPDGWSWTAYAGGNANPEDIVTPINGDRSIKAVHPGGASNGGGELKSDYVACTGGIKPTLISLVHYASAAGMKNKVILYWFDEDQVALTAGDISTELYNSTTNPTTKTVMFFGTVPPDDARFFKLGLIGGFTDTDVAGTAYWDDVILLEKPMPQTYGVDDSPYTVEHLSEQCLILSGVAGGGGAQAGAAKTAVAVYGGGGGEAGGFVRNHMISGLTFGSTTTITIGAGGAGGVGLANQNDCQDGSDAGDTSIGTIYVLAGGDAAGPGNGDGGTGGTGADGGNGTTTSPGADGDDSDTGQFLGGSGSADSSGNAGGGGASIFADGGDGIHTAGNDPGEDGTLGSGGGGSGRGTDSEASGDGGDGGPGQMIILWI